MARLGADLEQLAALRAALLRQAQTVEQMATELRGQLGATTWQGPAAERFRAQWSSEFEPALRRIQAALQDAGTDVGRHRDALQRAMQ